MHPESPVDRQSNPPPETSVEAKPSEEPESSVEPEPISETLESFMQATSELTNIDASWRYSPVKHHMVWSVHGRRTKFRTNLCTHSLVEWTELSWGCEIHTRGGSAIPQAFKSLRLKKRGESVAHMRWFSKNTRVSGCWPAGDGFPGCEAG